VSSWSLVRDLGLVLSYVPELKREQTLRHDQEESFETGCNVAGAEGFSFQTFGVVGAECVRRWECATRDGERGQSWRILACIVWVLAQGVLQAAGTDPSAPGT
jgi:hypothetical protein